MTDIFPIQSPDGHKISIGDTTYIYDATKNMWNIEDKQVEQIKLDSTKPLVIDDPVSEDEITYKFTIQETTESVHTIVYNVIFGDNDDGELSFFINGDENPNPELVVYRGYRYTFKFESPTIFELGEKYDNNTPFRLINYKVYEDGFRSNDDLTEYYFHVPLNAPDILAYRAEGVDSYPFMLIYDYYKYK